MKKTFKLYIILLIIGIFSINIFVQADYDKPVPPTEMKSEIIKSANTILDSVYNKRTNKTKYPTLESYIVYIDKVNDKLKVLKNTFISSDSRHILITYVISGLTNIKTSVKKEIILNPINTNTGITYSNQESVLTLTGDQTITGTKTFSSPIVTPTPLATNQLTTKDYVDNMVSAGSNNGAGSTCAGKLLYMKFTEGMYSGNLGGKSGADEKCNSEYPGYHFCHMTSILQAGREGCLQSLSSYYILEHFLYGRVEDNTDNCNNWTNETGNSSYFGTTSQTIGNWIYSHPSNQCGGKMRLLCCKR